MEKTGTGLENFLENPPSWIGTARVGLLTHPAAVDRSYTSSAQRLSHLLGPRLKALFGPQHGFWGDKQDNMIESSDSDHPLTGIRVHSLYGEHRRPTPEMLQGLDKLIIDLQDVGTRVYTFIQTMYLTLEACARAGVEVVVLDRPNPIGRQREGNLLEDDCRSFVGLFPIPMRHGLTMGEMARLIVARGISCPLEVIPLRGYDPGAGFRATGLPWVMPSTNMPFPETAYVYPGQVILEGTGLSEGRGTTRPFEIWGAPYINPHRLKEELAGYDLPGVIFRPMFFEPTFHKFAGQTCGGLFIHLTAPASFRPYRTSLALIQAVSRLWPKEWTFKEPPYEYEYERRPLDLILGDSRLADRLIQGEEIGSLEDGWKAGLTAFGFECGEIELY
jgi:uncharacterized protein YbbC (DUF1343 family)